MDDSLIFHLLVFGWKESQKKLKVGYCESLGVERSCYALILIYRGQKASMFYNDHDMHLIWELFTQCLKYGNLITNYGEGRE